MSPCKIIHLLTLNVAASVLVILGSGFQLQGPWLFSGILSLSLILPHAHLPIVAKAFMYLTELHLSHQDITVSKCIVCKCTYIVDTFVHKCVKLENRVNQHPWGSWG